MSVDRHLDIGLQIVEAHPLFPYFLPAHASEQGNVIGLVSVYIYIYIYYIPPPLTVHFSMTRSVRYQPILHTLYYTLHTEHAYYLSYCFLNNVVITTVIEMVEMVEILDGRLGKRSVERVRYVINNLLHLVVVKYGDISLVLCISTRFRLVTILSLLVKYLVILHADPCNKFLYICHQKKIVIERTRDLIYLKCVATDFSPKIISPSTGENSGDSA